MEMGLETNDWETNWEIVERAITKVKKKILKGVPNEPIEPSEYIKIYTTIYNMYIYERRYDEESKLYHGYRKSLEEFITSTVSPSLRDRHDEFLLREVAKMWSDYKILVKWLLLFFRYLDHTALRSSAPSLNMTGLSCFRDLVYEEIKGKVRDAAILLIARDREGEQIDRTLLKNVLDIFVEINGSGRLEQYENDFEVAMLEDTAAYYSRKASSWILSDYSPSSYMHKAEQCLMQEKARVSQYLHASSVPKLIAKVWHKLYTNQLIIEEEIPASLRDDKSDDPHPVT